mmetsp:Transcript_2799/g.2328  ORF Transcript_2799/g.2328 Transcript_2799/m.2328 type:complete len:119 (-) Transcript_2799:31-387(-)
MILKNKIASIHNIRGKLIHTKHQIQTSKNEIGRILTWKERVNFGEVLKQNNIHTDYVPQNEFFKEEKNKTMKLSKNSSKKIINKRRGSDLNVLSSTNKTKKKSNFRRVQSAIIKRRDK